jgi:hypothetical protein
MKDVLNYEGIYAISEDGKVFAYDKKVKVGNNGGYRDQHGFFLKFYKTTKKTDHSCVYLAKEGRKKRFFIHRLIATAFIENPHNHPFVNHKDGNASNNSIENLEWCTAKQNSKHAYDMGFLKMPNQSGANNSNAKLSNDEVIAIRGHYEIEKNISNVAKKFNIKKSTAWTICTRKSWTNI